ncbi:MAG: VWA domain-containing protein [Gammaproteobacteria bacterium]|nr:VWA domain-containing protein [Gammaproteobacteria bacterium]NIR84544.1 VWA domain-containing protein [Gammaproteobacteria bacterium]NIR90447.1 VWA domain-containing protein [Gammaproteobacteria bacterium]NIU05595.1 VWA domain-containing protein [Gammaproteobacteria bacterium]NIV52734.1 VWA domain-containing protein [Gammaproteobacteria bacterium]
MSKRRDKLPRTSSSGEVDAFLRKVAATPLTRPGRLRGRLVFAMDATASREPTWDRASHIQAEMFEETAALGGLDVQLCYYRGFREFDASAWFERPADLHRYMRGVGCVAGMTQIARVLRHVIAETDRQRVNALVFVGDCMEEDIDELCGLAGELGLRGLPAFVFQEGYDRIAERAFRQIAQLTRGAYCRFDASSAQQLKDLLSAVAVYAAGGRRALEHFGRRRGGAVRQLTHQMNKG